MPQQNAATKRRHDKHGWYPHLRRPSFVFMEVEVYDVPHFLAAAVHVPVVPIERHLAAQPAVDPRQWAAPAGGSVQLAVHFPSKPLKAAGVTSFHLACPGTGAAGGRSMCLCAATPTAAPFASRSHSWLRRNEFSIMAVEGSSIIRTAPQGHQCPYSLLCAKTTASMSSSVTSSPFFFRFRAA